MNILIIDLEDSLDSSSMIFKESLYKGLSRDHNIRILLRKNSQLIESIPQIDFIELTRASDFFRGSSGYLSKLIYFIIKRGANFIKKYCFLGIDIFLIFKARLKLNGYIKNNTIDLVLTISHPIESHFSVPSRTSCKVIQYWFEQWYINSKKPNSSNVAKKIRKLAASRGHNCIYSNTSLFKENTSISNTPSFVLGPISTSKEQIKISVQNIEFGYYGNFDPKVRNIGPLYEALKGNRANSLIVGNGRKLASENSLKVINKRISNQDAITYEKSTRNLFIILNNKHNAWPGKLYSYSSLPSLIIVLYDVTNVIHLEIQREFETFRNFVFLENKLDVITKFLVEGKPQVHLENDNKFSSRNIINGFNRILIG